MKNKQRYKQNKKKNNDKEVKVSQTEEVSVSLHDR